MKDNTISVSQILHVFLQAQDLIQQYDHAFIITTTNVQGIYLSRPYPVEMMTMVDQQYYLMIDHCSSCCFHLL